MIYCKFNIRNPWSNRWDNISCYSGQISQHKFWELQFMKTTDLICFEFSYNIKQDHAGLQIEFGLAGYNACFQLYDNRHWDEELNEWQK